MIKTAFTIPQSSCYYPSFPRSAFPENVAGTFFLGYTFYTVSPSLFFLPFQSLGSWFLLSVLYLFFKSKWSYLGILALILAQIAINMVLRKLFFFFWLLTFSYPHSSEGLLVLEHRRKIHMAPRGVLNVIPMVGWGNCRLDRLPNSKSFSISLVSE